MLSTDFQDAPEFPRSVLVPSPEPVLHSQTAHGVYSQDQDGSYPQTGMAHLLNMEFLGY